MRNVSGEEESECIVVSFAFLEASLVPTQASFLEIMPPDLRQTSQLVYIPPEPSKDNTMVYNY